MKKLTFLFAVMLLASSCTCLMSQIPPQMIYAGEGCAAPLPNYVTLVAVSDNCQIKSVTQTPSAGFMLNSDTQTTTVKIRATDAFDNWTEVSFQVTLIDTVKPVGEYVKADKQILQYGSP